MGVNPALAVVFVDYFIDMELNSYFKIFLVMYGDEATDYNVMYFKGLTTSV